MEWSPQQLVAQEKFTAFMAAWRRDHRQQLFKLAGYAGTGKTALAGYLGGSTAIYTAFTGKAATVLRQNGCVNARNIDQLLYRPGNNRGRRRDLLDDEFVPTAGVDVPRPNCSSVQPNEELERVLAPRERLLAGELIVIDEGSMVPNAMIGDLLQLGKPILVLYDPAQLPPVANDSGELIAGEPDVFLTEIHRQARDDPIIKLSMMARRGDRIPAGEYGDDCIVASMVPVEKIIDCGVQQILCGSNKTRQLINDAVRVRDGRTHWFPEPGERLVCLRNLHQQRLLNGSIWMVCRVTFGSSRYTKEPLIRLELASEDAKLVRRIDVLVASFHEIFDFAYCLTVHKAQGSQWDSVLLIDEARAMKYGLGIDPNRWRYTGITRAAKELALVKKLAA